MYRWSKYGAVLILLFSMFDVASSLAQERGINLSNQPAKTSERRVALVIGNSNYRSSPLRNPVNDAKAMSRSLREVGFDVIELLDASRSKMRRSMIDFGKRLKGGGVGLFYYAGHGVQVNGENFLVPVNAEIEVEDHVEIESVSLNQVLGRMGGAKNRLNIVILDACRNNPFARGFRSSQNGLAQTLAPSGTYIAYATAPGDIAEDGKGRNSTFTASLIKTLNKPGLSLERTFKQVRAEVQSVTKGKQVPWTSSSITGEFFFKNSEPSAISGGASGGDKETVFWQTIKDSKNPEEFKAYLRQYPKGSFGTLAQIKLAGLRELQKVPLPVSSTQITGMNATLFVDVEVANLRAAPSVNAQKLDSKRRGAEVSVTGRTPDNNWYRVALSNGKAGFIWGKLLSSELTIAPVPKATPTSGIVNIPQNTDRSWYRTFGGTKNDDAEAILPTKDGGYVVAGSSKSHGTGVRNAWVFKVDSEGRQVWQRKYGGSNYSKAMAILPSNDGGFIVAGGTSSLGVGRLVEWVFKLDKDGHQGWQRTYAGRGNDWATDIFPTTDGGYMVIGSSHSRFRGNGLPKLGFRGNGVLKLDSVGNMVWQHIRKVKWGVLSDIAPTADGGFVIAGWHMPQEARQIAASVFRLDSDGREIWERALGEVGSARAKRVLPTADGGFVVAGFTRSPKQEVKGAWVYKLDGNGRQVWRRSFGGVGMDVEISGMAPSIDGGYVIAGLAYLRQGGGISDAWVSKINAEGRQIWQRTFGGEKRDEARDISATADGGYAMAGWTETQRDGIGDAWVAKLDGDGRFGEPQAETKVAAVSPLPKVASPRPSPVQPSVGVYPKRYIPGKTFRDCSDCPEMVVIPAGSFMMGSHASEPGRGRDEGPQHRVTISKPLAVGKYEVTQSDWRSVMGTNPSGFKGDRRPVESISWKDTQEYLKKLNAKSGKTYRLLSEAEWEYAARAGSATMYSWGDGKGSGNANCDGCGSHQYSRKTAPVGGFPANAFGLHDMHGNVWEWVMDCWHDSLAGAPTDGSAWGRVDNCGVHVLRGGGFYSIPRTVRSANRIRNYSNYRNHRIGFRIVRNLAAGGSDAIVWRTIESSSNRTDFESFIAAYPDSPFVRFARNRIDQLTKSQTASLPLTKPLVPAMPNIEPLYEIYVVIKTANIRARPDVESNKITTLGVDTSIQVTGRTVDGKWLRIAHGGADAFVWSPLARSIDAGELAAWIKVKDSKTKTAIEGFLSTYPSGHYSVRAERLVTALTPLPKTAEPTPSLRPAVGVYPKRYTPGDTFKDCPNCPEMVVIPPGSFVMGDKTSSSGYGPGPRHRVTIGQKIAVGKFELTFDEWDYCVAQTACDHLDDPGNWGRGRRPVVAVDLEDIQSYLKFLNQMTGKKYRLLSEAEWEYVARAGRSGVPTVFLGVGGYRQNPRTLSTYIVGSFKPNKFGLFDFSGNVREIVQDCYVKNYQYAPTDGRAGTSGNCEQRIVRGGSAFRGYYRGKTITMRDSVHIYGGNADVGFRVALSLDD